MTTLNRRDALMGAAAALTGASAAVAQSSELIVTPGQTEGPFYPVQFPADADSDLVRVRSLTGEALGEVVQLSGRILNRRGQPIRGAQVEIWQCDARGVYRQPRDPPDHYSDGFQGFGRSGVDGAGRYAFRTIKPVPYPGRTPHIHYRVVAPGVGRLTTQLYIAGEPANARDGVFRGIRDPRAQASVSIPFRPAAKGFTAVFDIVLDA
jgi:protocatechuate 3,4-dioxygenase beta subunit